MNRQICTIAYFHHMSTSVCVFDGEVGNIMRCSSPDNKEDHAKLMVYPKEKACYILINWTENMGTISTYIVLTFMIIPTYASS